MSLSPMLNPVVPSPSEANLTVLLAAPLRVVHLLEKVFIDKRSQTSLHTFNVRIINVHILVEYTYMSPLGARLNICTPSIKVGRMTKTQQFLAKVSLLERCSVTLRDLYPDRVIQR